MRIAIIGAGRVGTTLGQRFVGASHEVVYASRRDDAVAPHAGATTARVPEAVRASDVAVLVTPWNAVEDALRAAGDFAGRPLIDVTNPVGPGFSLTHAHTTSGAEHVASLAKNARVVKAFNTTGLENMHEPRFGSRRAYMPVAGDDPEATAVALKLASDIGFDAVALDGIVRARELEPLALLWIRLAIQLGHGRGFALALGRRDDAGAAEPPRKGARAKRITIVGGGNIGGALGRAWLTSGHRVRVTARDTTSEEARAFAAAGAEVVPVEGAARGAEIVVLSPPYRAVAEALPRLELSPGMIVVDATNAIGKGFTLEHGGSTSSAEQLQALAPEVRVVRAFHQQGAEVLERPAFGDLRAASFVASDDAEARAVVRELSEEVGLEGIDAGPLSMARCLEPMTLHWIALSRKLGTREIGLAVVRRAV